MPKLLLILTLMLYFMAGNAQPPQGSAPSAPSPKGDGKIIGTLIDSLTSQPVEYATIALHDLETNKLVDGTITDDKGKFELNNVADGNYKLVINFLSYKTLERSPIVVNGQNKNVNAGSIFLQPDTKQLKEVVVQGQKVLIEEKVDRTVYNAENDATTKGGDATDVLRRVPLLSVDMDGNVSLRGSQNIKVLINNRPSTISAGSVADALKQIPADLIKTVEVITSPSAKYDAEGSGGIINIILKKNNLEGFSLGVDASAGFRASNLGLNGSYNKGKMRFSLGGFGRGGYNTPGAFNNNQTTRNTDGSQSNNIQHAGTRNNYVFGNYTLGWDYDINDHNFLTASVRYGARNNYNYQDQLSTQTYLNNSLTNHTIKDVNVTDVSGTVDLSLNYTHTFKKPQQEFSLLTLYSQNNRTNDFINNNLDTTSLDIFNRLKNQNQSVNKELSFQADYQTPVGKTQMLEFGGKDIIRKVSSDYKYLFANGDNNNFVPLANASLSNIFNYNQNVAAGYLSYTLNFLTLYSLKAGTRYEHTTISADFKNGQSVPVPSYGVLVPSVNLSRKFKNGNMLKAAFTRRIQRPSIQFLNPNIQAANPLNYTIGNPSLSPEYTNNYELSYSTNIKKTFLTLSAFMRNTTGSIQSVRDVLGRDTIRTSYANIGKQDAYGSNIFANVNLSNKFSLNGGVDIFYAILNNNVADPLFNAHNEGWVVSGRLFGSYNLPKNWGLQFFGFYRGRQVQLQGYQGGFGIYSLSIKKDFNDKKGSIGFGAENFFTPSITIKNELNSPVISQTSSNVLHNFNFKVNFSYRIGKMSVDNNARKRKSLNNDDLKEGGDNNPAGGGGMQGGGGAPPQGGGGPGGPPPGFKPGQAPPAGFQPGQGPPPGWKPGDGPPPGFKPGQGPPSGWKPGDPLPPGFKPGQDQPDQKPAGDENKDKKEPAKKPEETKP